MKPALSLLLVLAVMVLSACGDKMPESAASRQMGAAPKQIVDKAAADAAKAVDQGAARSAGADEGK